MPSPAGQRPDARSARPERWRFHCNADFNRDGTIDDYAALDAGTVVVQLRNADGTYQPAQTYAAGSNPGSIAAGDFNGDGWTDLVVVNSLSSGNPTLSVLFNDGSW